MIKLGIKRTSPLRVGDWVYTKERFIDGFELVPFVDASGAPLESRAFQTQYYPDLWRAHDAFVNPWPDIDKTAGSVFFPSNFGKANVAQIYRGGSTVFVGKYGNNLYVSTAIDEISDHKTGVGNYKYSGLPKGYKSALLTLDNYEKIKLSNDNGASWIDFIDLGRVINCFDVGRYCTDVLVASSIYDSDSGLHVSHVVLCDETTGSLVTTELPTVGLGGLRIDTCHVFQAFDANYNQDNKYVVRFMANQTTDPVFAFFNKAEQKWIPVVVPLQYAAYTSGSEPVISADYTKIYWAYEQHLYVFDFATGKFLKRVQIASKTNNPPTNSGSPVWNNDNFSYNCNGIEALRLPYMPDPDYSGEPKYHDAIVIAGSERVYIYVDDGKNIVDVLYNLIGDETPKPAFLAAKDANIVYLVLKNGIIKTYNGLPPSAFVIKAIKENGVVNTGYSLVVRKMP